MADRIVQMTDRKGDNLFPIGVITTASKDKIGGVKVGDGLEITSDGTLNATGGGGDLPDNLAYIGDESSTEGTDKIVQLIDKDGNNIFPITKDSSDGRIARVDVSVGNGGNALFYRTGNVVSVSCSTVCTSCASGTTTIGQVVPVGFRPASKSGDAYPGSFLGIKSDASGAGGVLVYRVEPNGTVHRWSSNTSSSGVRIEFAGSWATNDPFPDQYVV